MFKAMLMFKSRKKLQEEIHQLKHDLGEEQMKKANLLADLGKAKQEVTALRNVIRRQDELLAKNKKRIKDMQAIINKQNEKLGFGK
jgi:septal ring factor EnvC (AmiA/AmiB activator)